MSSATLNRVLSDPNWAADRIEALEKALREILAHPAGLYEDQAEIVHAALAPEQDK